MSNEKDLKNIQSISYSKLAEYDQARIDLPIRRYVLISNLLQQSPSNELEQQWFDTCINELEKEQEQQVEQDIYLHAFIRHKKGIIVCTSHL